MGNNRTKMKGYLLLKGKRWKMEKKGWQHRKMQKHLLSKTSLVFSHSIFVSL
jgi:hypothetical protein